MAHETSIHEASFFERLERGKVRCLLCPHRCVIAEGNSGICGARTNRGGILVSDIYGQVSAIAMDPIEKKPLYHFHPGSQILSIGTKGCNLKCPYCQNWHISQDLMARTAYHSPESIVETAVREGSVGIAYTYSEPIIWYEYVRDTAERACDKGLKNVLVTNGYINTEPLRDLLPLISAMNIDLKSFREDTYKSVQKGGLNEVLAAIKQAHDARCHIEITTLIVTGMNDRLEEMRDIIDFIASINPDIPWHISRYYPNYCYDRHATDVSFMMKVHEEAEKKLNFVYCGNVPTGSRGHDTLCPSCHEVVITRSGYWTRIVNLKGATCGSCGHDLPIVR